ncbi:lipopolysaccharide transport periplasmic protein LptA [Aquabacterium sp. A7-Y]|uniref:lipopolysaccharide transport periplasmic protein LptA n=1 Tax=Aquabacterium sp. A7-Y TaxID=1349605 RepID=UPI00223E0111|nr:lipopolysaccharide transport periplasmic protein LptA [Aquabacterium sp. A7-Y]MCW7538873.1 lipopolysaccharide transport periplasmic protein LptA [Aquabacterium sp. A7-Y]
MLLPPTFRPLDGSRRTDAHALPALLLALALACVAGPAAAERADRNKPLNFSADNLRYDDAKQTNVLTGNVVITKGTMVMRAARVEVRQTPDGQQSAVGVGSGRPAFFRQKREAVNEYIEGEAERIEYDTRSDTLRLIGNAQIRRYRGDTLADEVAGQTITYNNGAEVFTVDGAATGAPGGRVRGVLSPRNPPPGEAAASVPAPAASATPSEPPARSTP